ncbi:hypothetical protein OIU74_000317 [Salix koriyanagi]|uniref:Uncharacterized protein n=1 Tax=Salix koriyanagi TaxID=2511006 RepID=A0A9Q1AM86_9ROSI|nr:hypothetical protein OIU74_000317 [Salix koriyanagi]
MEKVLSCVHDAYNDQTGSFVVPESLRMKKDMTSKRDVLQLKAYRTKNRHFVSRNDCSDILDWIRTTQGEAMSVVLEVSSNVKLVDMDSMKGIAREFTLEMSYLYTVKQ